MRRRFSLLQLAFPVETGAGVAERGRPVSEQHRSVRACVDVVTLQQLQPRRGQVRR